MKKRLKIKGLFIAAGSLLVVIFPRFFIRNAGYNLWDELCEIIGVFLVLFGQAIRMSARGYKSENSGQGRELVVAGPYSLVRNPMYLGVFCIGIGIVLAIFSWWALFLFLPVFLFGYIPLIYKEEKKLGELFGQDYAKYREKTPRMFPSLSGLFKRDIREYFILKWAWIKKDLGSTISILAFIFCVEAYEEIRNEGWRAFAVEAAYFLLAAFLSSCLILLFLSVKDENAKNISN